MIEIIIHHYFLFQDFSRFFDILLNFKKKINTSQYFLMIFEIFTRFYIFSPAFYIIVYFDTFLNFLCILRFLMNFGTGILNILNIFQDFFYYFLLDIFWYFWRFFENFQYFPYIFINVRDFSIYKITIQLEKKGSTNFQTKKSVQNFGSKICQSKKFQLTLFSNQKI